MYFNANALASKTLAKPDSKNFDKRKFDEMIVAKALILYDYFAVALL